MVETVFTDDSMHALGTIPDSGLNVAYGVEDNDWEMTVRADVDIPHDGFVFARLRDNGVVTGTEYGGIVKERNPRYDSSLKEDVVTYGGPSWHGMLNNHVICPPSGQEHLHISGEANSAIGAVISALGMTDLFSASTDASGITVSHDFRYILGYDGLRDMLSESNAKLKMAFDGSKVILHAEAIHDYSQDQEFDQSQVHLDIKIDGNPVNHLVCLGSGEGTARLRVDIYADANGTVSTTQTQFGSSENAEIYDYTSADLDTLNENGRKKLQDYQDAAKTIDVTVEATTEFDVGDIIGAVAQSGATTDTVSAFVTYKSATVNGDYLDVTYKAGAVLKSSSETAAQEMTAQSLAALNEAIAAQTKADNAVVASYDEYAISDSNSDPPADGWSANTPAWEQGRYIWRRVVTEKGDGTTEVGSPALMTGNTGEDATLVRVDSSRGLVFKNNSIATVLMAVIFHGSERIEDIETLRSVYGATAYIEWSWQRIGDESFSTISIDDSRIGDDGFTFTITSADVDTKTVFQATVRN